MEKELIARGIRDPEIARRILCATEPDPGELRMVSSMDDTDWLPTWDFAVYEDCNKNLHTLAWFPPPPVMACVVATMAAAYQYARRICGDYPEGLRASCVTIAEDTLSGEPIARIGMRCGDKPITIDMGAHAIMQADEVIKIIKGEV